MVHIVRRMHRDAVLGGDSRNRAKPATFGWIVAMREYRSDIDTVSQHGLKRCSANLVIGKKHGLHICTCLSIAAALAVSFASAPSRSE